MYTLHLINTQGVNIQHKKLVTELYEKEGDYVLKLSETQIEVSHHPVVGPVCPVGAVCPGRRTVDEVRRGNTTRVTSGGEGTTAGGRCERSTNQHPPLTYRPPLVSTHSTLHAPNRSLTHSRTCHAEWSTNRQVSHQMWTGQ